jgi:preprotein translocase subunit SecB
MHASNLQLEHYFLTEFSYSVNPEFDPDKAVEIRLADIVVNYSKQCLNSDDPRAWQVDLKVEFLSSAERNVPYSFSASIIGFFVVSPKVLDDKVELFVETNATSVLYSTLREIVCTITAKGPFRALLLPTLSFYERSDKQVPQQEDGK